jgi:hypothetical protein
MCAAAATSVSVLQLRYPNYSCCAALRLTLCVIARSSVLLTIPLSLSATHNIKQINDGQIDVDQAALTGESLPVTMGAGGNPKVVLTTDLNLCGMFMSSNTESDSPCVSCAAIYRTLCSALALHIS